MTRALLLALVLAGGAGLPAFAQDFRQPAPKWARVYFIAPVDGAKVKGPVKLKFGLVGMPVAPAGTEAKGAGHHHLLVDTELKDLNAAIPADDKHRHFGKGETEATLMLAPGTHTLQLVMGDHQHIPHNPPIMSKVITITVEPAEPAKDAKDAAKK